jgi:hypothetical protein
VNHQVAAIGDDQALDLIEPPNASVADSKQATTPPLEEPESCKRARREQCQSVWFRDV